VKVTGFEVFPVVCPPPFRGGRNWLFVRLDTDGGTHGYGEMIHRRAADDQVRLRAAA
jgi:L-alanine-DL-glutamate epimerase-like enolase superfamily enzyme